MKRLTALLLAALFLVMPLAGCSSDKQDEQTAIEEEDKGAIIQTYLTSAPASIDPSAMYGSSENIKLMGLLYEGLTTINENGKLEKALAKEWEYEIDERDDYMKLEITLNSSRWSDGIIVDAEDFIYAWTRILKPENKNENAALLYPVLNAKKAKEGLVSINDVGLTAVKDNVIEIVFEKEYSDDDFVEYFLRRLASPALVPLREDIVSSKEGWDVAGRSSYVTNGPFKIKIWDSYELSLERSVYYRAVSDNDGNKDDKIVKPYRIVNLYREGGNSTEQFQRYRDEQEPSNKVFYVSLAGASPEMVKNAGDLKKTDVETTEMLSTYCLFFNTNNELLADARVRKALSIVIDREALAELAVGSKPATGLIPYGIEDVKAKQDFREKGGDIISSKANVEEAKKLLKEAGVSGGKLKAEASNARDYEKRVLNLVASAWKEIGITLEVSTRRSDYIYNKANALSEFTLNEVDVLAFDLQSMTSDAYGMLMQFSSEFGGHPIDVTTGPSEEDVVYTPYFTGFADEEYDKLCEKIVAAVTAKERTAAMHEAEQYLLENASPVAPLFFNCDTYLVSNQLSGIKQDKFGRLDLINLKQKSYDKYLPEEN